MQIDLISTSVRGSTVVVSHGNESIAWRVSERGDERVLLDELEPTFQLCNEIYAKMPGAAQAEIFAVMQRIKVLISEEFRTEALIMGIRELAVELMRAHDYAFIRREVGYDIRIIVPTKCDVDYVDSDEKPGSRAQTFTRGDYLDQVALSVLIKPMIPIWLEFAHYTKGETRRDSRESYAWGLLDLTYVPDLPGVLKLKEYIQCFLQKTPSSLSVMVTGVGTDDYPELLLANVMVNRIAYIDALKANVNSNGKESNVITGIYYYIRGAAEGGGAQRTGASVKEKRPPTDSDTGDNRGSVLESYKMQETLDPGMVTALRVEADNLELIAKRLFGEMDAHKAKLLDIFLERAGEHVNRIKHDCQTIIAQYVLVDLIPCRAWSNYTEPQTCNLIAIAQTWLWIENFQVLAALIGASALGDTNATYISGMTSRTRIPQSHLDEIEKIFPMAFAENAQRVRQVNPITKAIDALNDGFSACDWEIHLTPQMTEMLTGHPQITSLQTPSDIKKTLAELIIRLNKP